MICSAKQESPFQAFHASEEASTHSWQAYPLTPYQNTVSIILTSNQPYHYIQTTNPFLSQVQDFRKHQKQQQDTQQTWPPTKYETYLHIHYSAQEHQKPS